jgi:predicted GH43/DUF377 family glycosyl hydrolase
VFPASQAILREQFHDISGHDGTWTLYDRGGIAESNRMLSALGKIEIAITMSPMPKIILAVMIAAGLTMSGVTAIADPAAATAKTWTKSPTEPVLGGKLGTCFDLAMLVDPSLKDPHQRYRMYFSWRPKKAVALVTGDDGIHWSDPVIVLPPGPADSWESDVNRPVVVHRGDKYLMWYTGQAKGKSAIGFATSDDGITWQRQPDGKPVLTATEPWEKVAVMCPHVILDDNFKQYRMWYSGGEQYEPDAIGYATSDDGIKWTKRAGNPIFAADPKSAWEKHKVTACQVTPDPAGGGYLMFYVGFRDVDHAAIGVARSADGITDWHRLSANPIVSPTADSWDADACYKPFAVCDGKDWQLWYNGRRGSVEQIGRAVHEGIDLGFKK